MPRGDKSKYTPEQTRKADAIADSYRDRGVSGKEAEARAWATVNKQSGGGESAGSGRSKSNTVKKAERKDSAQRAASARKGHSPNAKRGPASGGQQQDSTSLSKMTVEQLQRKAAERHISGRSRMRKAELLKALASA